MNKAAEMIKECMEEKNLTQTKLAERMSEDRRNLNQQLFRQKDMKVERFVEIMNYIGYRVEIAENDGIQKVSNEFSAEIIEKRKPEGLFWTEEDGKYVGIDNSTGDAFTEDFDTKERCFAWLRGVLTE